ncbi:MAG: nucleoside monophosphate kinase [Candidatus Levybacteria bacterium]|nr:nucleoside monophosphate kinase [Candidatus Levybacteria bacterium]
MKIVLIGIQGAGKSTQGNLLSEKLKIPYLSTGHIFRELAKEKTKIGRYIKEVMNAGYLIPDKKTVAIVDEYLKRQEYKNGYIIDGFPRTIAQAEFFKDGADKVIYLKVSDGEALKRLSFRNGDNGVREDETPSAIAKRIELFHKLTKPVFDYYRKKGILIEIDGERAIEEIHEDILTKLGK